MGRETTIKGKSSSGAVAGNLANQLDPDQSGGHEGN